MLRVQQGRLVRQDLSLKLLAQQDLQALILMSRVLQAQLVPRVLRVRIRMSRVRLVLQAQLVLQAKRERAVRLAQRAQQVLQGRQDRRVMTPM